MYSVFVCAAFALAFAFGGSLLDWYHWGWAIPIAVVLFAVSWIILARRLAARLQPAMARMQKQMEAGMLDAAMESLESLLPLSRWIPMLKGQVLGNMGMLAYHTGKKERAIELLSGASLRAPDAQLMLACIHYKNEDVPKALQIMALASKVNKKHALLHNTYAWMLSKSNQRDQAQSVLAAFVKRDDKSAVTKDNLLRLQNRTRMTMAPFEMQWYALGLERPPQTMGQMRRAPKGFREPRKRKGG